MNSNIDGLRAVILDRDADVGKLRADDKISDSFRRQLIDQVNARAADDGHHEATKAWQRANRRRDAARSSLAAAAQQVDQVNWEAVQARASYYRVSLKTQEYLGAPVEQRLATLMAQAEHSPEARMAVQTVVGELDLPADGRELASTGALLATLARWEAERLAPLTAAQAELSAAEQDVAETRAAILEAESLVTGVRRNPSWPTVSEWERSVLGESERSLGYIVDKPEPAAV